MLVKNLTCEKEKERATFVGDWAAQGLLHCLLLEFQPGRWLPE